MWLCHIWQQQQLQPYLIMPHFQTSAPTIFEGSSAFVNNTHQWKLLHYVCRPALPPVLKRNDGNGGGRASILGSWRQSRDWVWLTRSLLTSAGNHAICSVPTHPRRPKQLQTYSAPICISQERGGVSSYVPTSADGLTPQVQEVWALPEVTPLPPALQLYSFSRTDNYVVALFSLLWQPHSCINCSFPCISFTCWLASQRSVVRAGEWNESEVTRQNSKRVSLKVLVHA